LRPLERRQAKALSEGWLIDLIKALDDFPGEYFLVITERPVDISDRRPYSKDAHICFVEYYRTVLMILDLSDVKDEERRLNVLKEARDYIRQHALENTKL